jgi:Antibiotic biosynthesis monooxygenase
VYGVLRDYTLDVENVAEVIRRVAEGGVPILRAIPGFVSYTVMDAGRGHLVTYSLYESRTGTEESTRKAAAWVKENIAPLLPSPPRVLEGKVRLREIKEQPKYGVIRRYRVAPKDVEELVTRARSGFLPLLAHLPGFASYSILDGGSGTLVTLSGYTAQAGADESTRAAATFVKEHLGPLVQSPPEVTLGEVRLTASAAGQSA